MVENNCDLLKQFSEEINIRNLSFEDIQTTLQNPNIVNILMKAFDEAKKDIRMEEPIRLLTRFALNFAKNMVVKGLHEP